MSGRGWLWLTILGCGVLAAPAALPGALDHRKGEFQVSEWLPTVLCFWVASAALLVAATGVFGRSTPAWSRILAALAMAALAPLAVEETQYHLQSAAAFVAIVLAVGAGLSETWWVRGPISAILTAVSCGLDATGFLWPLGVLCAGGGRGGARACGACLLIAGVVGVVVGRTIGLSSLTGHSYDGVAYSLHRDLLVCLPVVVLGAAGLARSRRGDAGDGVQTLAVYAAFGLAAMLPIILGIRLNVRMAALALWWLAPLGLTDLGEMIARRRERPAIVGAFGGLSVLAVLVLAWPGVSAWFNAVLLAAAVLLARF